MTKKTFLLLAMMLSSIIATFAAVKGEIDKSSLRCWGENETPKIVVTVINPDAVQTVASISLSLTTDTQAPFCNLTKDITLAGSDTTKVVFDNMRLTPGFYRATVIIDGNKLNPFNLGYHPEAIESPIDSQPDFDTFWQQALNELAQVTPDYKLTRDPWRSSSEKNVYLVEMKSLPDSTGGEPVTIRGFYTEPVAPGKYPALITYQGYDGGTSQIYYGNPDDKPGWVEFYLSTRGQLLDNRSDSKNRYGDFFAYNFGDKDKYYYRSAFMDVVRAIDFITSR